MIIAGHGRLMAAKALGLTYEQYKALPSDRLAEERARIGKMFAPSRPHYLIDTIAELPEVIDDINARLARGETPQSC